ncbi:hypothetical protein AAC387_Pa06g1733 [Persea americana]
MKRRFSGSPFASLLPMCFWCVVHLLYLVEISQVTNATTDPSQVRALNSIFQKWGVFSPWNTADDDPCTGNATLNTINPSIKCQCNFNSGTTCHITQLKVYGLEATGTIPEELGNLTKLSYLGMGSNNFNGSLPPELGHLVNLEEMNLVANNFVLDDYNSITFPGLKCLQRNFPCNRGSPIHSSFAINCGGQSITSSSTGIVYDEDEVDLQGASYDVTDTIRWAVDNVGKFVDNNNPAYISNSQSQFTNTLESKLFQSARLSPSSVRYYGLGLENGNYTISLQFAEMTFEYARTWESVGRRVFDIYIQGSLALKDFDIRKAAGGVQFKTVEREFKALVSENHLEIHLFWAGKGTCCVPVQGTYGPSISALLVTPDFTPTVSNRPVSNRPLTTYYSKKSKTGLVAEIVVPIGVVCLIFIFGIFTLRQRRLRKSQDEELVRIIELVGIGADTFSYSELKTATEEFSPGNRLGEGGFGPVYKGALSDGRVIAVKKLSVATHQGNSQFMTGIATISTVQHRNLVKLYGCCIEGDRRLLVYEYLENKSLDQALFGAWHLHENNRALDLVNTTLVELNEAEALRMIGVGLLCTQATPMLRPPMSRVVAMLSGDIEVSSVTSKPGYITDWQLNEITSFVSEDTSGPSTEWTSSSRQNTSSNSSTVVIGHSSESPCQPILHEIIG